MFEILVLGCINDGSYGLFNLPRDVYIYIEITNGLNQLFEGDYLFFKYFGVHEVLWNSNSIKVGTKGDDKY